MGKQLPKQLCSHSRLAVCLLGINIDPESKVSTFPRMLTSTFYQFSPFHAERARPTPPGTPTRPHGPRRAPPPTAVRSFVFHHSAFSAVRARGTRGVGAAPAPPPAPPGATAAPLCPGRAPPGPSRFPHLQVRVGADQVPRGPVQVDPRPVNQQRHLGEWWIPAPRRFRAPWAGRSRPRQFPPLSAGRAEPGRFRALSAGRAEPGRAGRRRAGRWVKRGCGTARPEAGPGTAERPCG